MEVVLKRTKITKSIVNQALQGKDNLYFNEYTHDILGWCVLNGRKNERWILLYNRVTNTLVRLPYAQKLSESDEIRSRNEQLDDKQGGYIYPRVFRLYTYLVDQYKSQHLYRSEDETEIFAKKDKLHEFLRIVNQKGQIFI